MSNTTSRDKFLSALDIVQAHFQVLHEDACKNADECGTDIGLYMYALELNRLLEHLREAYDACLEGAKEDTNQG